MIFDTNHENTQRPSTRSGTIQENTLDDNAQVGSTQFNEEKEIIESHFGCFPNVTKTVTYNKYVVEYETIGEVERPELLHYISRLKENQEKWFLENPSLANYVETFKKINENALPTGTLNVTVYYHSDDPTHPIVYEYEKILYKNINCQDLIHLMESISEFSEYRYEFTFEQNEKSQFFDLLSVRERTPLNFRAVTRAIEIAKSKVIEIAKVNLQLSSLMGESYIFKEDEKYLNESHATAVGIHEIANHIGQFLNPTSQRYLLPFFTQECKQKDNGVVSQIPAIELSRPIT